MSLITPFNPWKSKYCTCPPKYSLSAYTGCGHNCLYCYASSYIKDFYRPREKKEFVKTLKREAIKIPKGSFIAIANSSDPYLPLENELKLTRECLKILKEYDIKLMLVTKSSLILRDLDIIKNCKKVVIAVTITTLNNNLAKIMEPFASEPKDRLKTVEKLSKYVTVVCRFDPLIYPLNTKDIKNTVTLLKNAGAKQIITSTYKARPDNLKRMMEAFPKHSNLWKRLYIETGERINRYMYLPFVLRKEIIQEVKEASISVKIDFSSCREGFNNLNTKICDGSSFLQ